MNESTEDLLQTLRSSIDALLIRMQLEIERSTIEMHYHFVESDKCYVPGCSGVDPVLATYNLLQEEIVFLDKTYPHHLIPAHHIP